MSDSKSTIPRRCSQCRCHEDFFTTIGADGRCRSCDTAELSMADAVRVLSNYRRLVKHYGLEAVAR